MARLADSQRKRPARVGEGHPTLYKPEYCEQMIAHCKQGYSFDSFAGKLLISRETLYNWRKEHTEFFDAANISKEACRTFWETVGRNGVMGMREITIAGETKELGAFNGGSWQFVMKNFFRDEWSDTYVQRNEGIVQTHELSDEDWWRKMEAEENKVQNGANKS
jgi:hypothetical protein